MSATALQVVLCWYESEESAGGAPPPEFIEAANRAFAGRGSPIEMSGGAAGVPNWITGSALRPVAFRRFPKVPEIEAGVLLDGALHTLVVAWVSEALLAEKPSFVAWLGKVWDVVDKSKGRHGLEVGVPDERLRRSLLTKAKGVGAEALAKCQMRTWESLGEEAARPAILALRVLEKARKSLIQGMDQQPQRLQLFISHAKIDGLSIAESLTHAVDKVSGLEKFYDAHDMESGENWEAQLEAEAKSSVMIAVRTDQYDSREMCVKEVSWADSAGAPIIVVEARSELFYPPSRLGLEGCPWVRIPDGSLTRILYSALRENLQLLLVRRGVHALGPGISGASVVLPRAPSWNSLDGALSRLPALANTAIYVVYPDPMLLPTISEALNRFVASRNNQARVVNYSSLVSGAEP